MSDTVVKRDYLLSPKLYDQAKRLAQVGLPALGTFYFTLAQIWDLPYSEQVLGTIVALNALLGVLLGYSKKSYDNSQTKYDGALVVLPQPDGTELFSLELNNDPEDLKDRSEIVFAVKSS